MKHLILLLTAVIAACTASAQNFIPNADFVSYSVCPTSYSQTANCTDWYQPTGGTSDYFNACAAGTDVHVPTNFIGDQTSSSSAYLGLVCYLRRHGSYDDYREYIGTSFAPLTVGKKYDITVYTSLADSSKAAVNGLGIFFTTYRIQTAAYSIYPATPQIDFSNYGLITDKVNWVKLTGSFIADSAYTNLAIGNFKPPANLTIAYNNDPTGAIKDTVAYYYIGSIQVADSTGILPPADTTKYVFPSAFTPNGDTHNDAFRIIGLSTNYNGAYEFSVYNRWGTRVFFTNDAKAGWDGIFNDLPAELGVYFYMASFTVNGKHHLLKGDVTLVR